MGSLGCSVVFPQPLSAITFTSQPLKCCAHLCYLLYGVSRSDVSKSYVCSEETLAEVAQEIPITTDLRTPYLPPALSMPTISVEMVSFSGVRADKEVMCIMSPATNKSV